ncbi:MAG: proline racemase [Candidatus Aminicenantes bacterium]|nr:proline racemase [Candidatus Aminicenantes bacterium]
MNSDWKPPSGWKGIETLEAHTAGEPLRLITKGLPAIPGDTILEKRRYFRRHLDHIRTGLMWEPRGHADMYGAVLTEPVSSDADFGVFFLHNQGYSTMCGHAIVALAKMTLDTGMIKKQGSHPEVRIDTPAGLVRATALREKGTVQQVSFLNVPSFVYKKDLEVRVPDLGLIHYDIGFGGAFYVFCKAQELKVSLKPDQYSRLIHLGRVIKKAVMESVDIRHPLEEELGFLYGTIITGSPVNPSHHSRNVCIFADGQVDRSPTGTGVSARAAIHYSRGELRKGETVVIESIIGSEFQVCVKKETRVGDYPAVIPEVTGSASIIGQNQFYFDPDDPFKKGFILR